MTSLAVVVKHSSYTLAAAAALVAAPGGFGTIERLDPALDALVAPGTVIRYHRRATISALLHRRRYPPTVVGATMARCCT